MFRKQTLAAAFAALLLGSAAPAGAQQQAAPQQPAPNIKTEAIIMLQNDALLGKRAVSVQEVGLYLKAVREAFAQAYAGVTVPETLNAIVAVKPGRKARLWIVSSLPNPPDRTALMARFQAVPVPEVRDGPIAFTIRFTVAGGTADRIPMTPPEWTKAFGGKPAVMPDAITTYIWTD